MPRVIVTTDPSDAPPDTAILLDERVESVHLSTGHAAAQLVERLAWAIRDAEDAESSPRSRRPRVRGDVPSRLSHRPTPRAVAGA